MVQAGQADLVPRERLTSGLAAAAFLWGAAIGHVYQWFANGDYAAGNTGGILANDVLILAVMIALAARDVRPPLLPGLRDRRPLSPQAAGSTCEFLPDQRVPMGDGRRHKPRATSHEPRATAEVDPMLCRERRAYPAARTSDRRASSSPASRSASPMSS
ncbi:DUF6790 family protein [Streptomyces noursei]|uniref:DUF6790 family protein n=1 Tax=Streptomyces noursei TaxID=1971 RepID=UPI0033312399